MILLRPSKAFIGYWGVLGSLKLTEYLFFDTQLKYNYFTIAIANICLFFPTLIKNRKAYPYLAVFSLRPFNPDFNGKVAAI
jgi:hypothetical protein